MITSRTKKQLIAFVVITLLGVTFVGARYARLDRLFYDPTYEVAVQLKESGGVFKGAEVTYRGVKVGQVSEMRLRKGGVDAILSIDNKWDEIPSATEALVANKSAVGEQYVDLLPKVDKGPYLKNDSKVAPQDTAVPVSTTEILTNLDQLVRSVPQGDLRTVVSELGAAFKGTGPSLAQIIDTSNAFIKTADDNFDVTTALIRDSNTVLTTQNAKESAIRSFSRDLALFSTTLAGADPDLRRLIDNGSASVTELRTFIEKNQVNLGQLINNLVTTGEVVVRHLPGVRQLLVIYPYVVAGGYTVTAKGPGGYDANFGLILTQSPPVCTQGYQGTRKRSPQERQDLPMEFGARCAAPAGQTNARGSQNAPRAVPDTSGASPQVASFDSASGAVTWKGQGQSGADRSQVVYDGGAERLVGKDSWKWMLLQPVAGATGSTD